MPSVSRQTVVDTALSSGLTSDRRPGSVSLNASVRVGAANPQRHRLGRSPWIAPALTGLPTWVSALLLDPTEK